MDVKSKISKLSSDQLARLWDIASDSEDLPSSEDIQPSGMTPQIEGFRIIGELGKGGMGTVWRAVQLSTQREVALKVMSTRAFGSSKALSRFEREVEIAARLQHPNITRVYESGIDRGLYYYVMELIDGQHLDTYAKQHTLSQKQILELVLVVCRAIQHAHQLGVIHRDLKPSNILVTDDGQPHILDFGLAKAIADKDTSLSLSKSGDMIGTLPYMSPEQAAGRQDELDTRTDVYSLGLMLYHLLAGESAHDLSGTHYTVMRRIAEEEVKRPRAINKRIDDELEALLLKSLAHKREDRYNSAGDLAEDIDGYLKGKPLTARSPTMTYQLRKFVKRHRSAVIVALLVFVALIAGLSMATVGFLRASRERNRAKRNFEMALSTVDKMTTLAEKQLQLIPGTEQVRRDILEKAKVFYAGFVEQNRDDKVIRSEIATAYLRLGNIHIALGNFVQARDDIEEAIELLEKLTIEFPDVSEHRLELCYCWGAHGYTYIWTDHPEELVKSHRKVIVLLQELVSDFPEEPQYQERLALAHTDLGNDLRILTWDDSSSQKAIILEEAESHYRRSLDILESLYADFPDTPKDLEILAQSHWWMGVHMLSVDQCRLTEAEQQLRQALSLREELLAEDPNNPWHRGTFAYVKSYIGNLLRKQGKLKEAERECREAMVIREKLLAEFPGEIEHQRRMGHLLRDLSEVFTAGGRQQEAEAALRQAIAHSESLTVRFPRMARFPFVLAKRLGKLGELFSETGQLEEAVQLFRDEIEVWEKLISDFPDMPKGRTNLAKAYRKLGDALKAAGQGDEADRAYQLADAMDEEVESEQTGDRVAEDGQQ